MTILAVKQYQQEDMADNGRMAWRINMAWHHGMGGESIKNSESLVVSTTGESIRAT